MTRPAADALAVLRDASWLTAARARAYATMLVIVLVLAAIWVAYARFHPPHAGAPSGKPEATDFMPFYAAGIMVREGHAPGAYHLDALTAVESRSVELGHGRLPFMYPPVLLLLCAWLAFLPEPAAYAAFEILGLVPLLFFLWRLLPGSRARVIVPLLTAPSLLMNFGSGQTGFFSAAAFAAAAILIADQPILAGICLGGLVFKPHFALLVPVALAASGKWRAFFACGITAAALCALSWLFLPAATWPAFFAQAGTMRVVMEHASTSALLISVFGALHVAGASPAIAYIVQAIAAVLCVILVVTASRRRPGGAAEMALTAATALCVTPYAMDYDLPVTMVPAIWMVAQAQRTGWRAWEKIAVAAIALLPLFARALVLLTGFQPAPLLLLAFLFLVWRRVMSLPVPA